MTLIDKAQAHDDDLIRRGDAVKLALDEGDWHGRAIAERLNALPARGIKIKPLVWKRYLFEDWKAASPFGEYRCVRTLYDMSALWLGDKKLGTYGGGSHTEAKVAAQADYEARIFAALAPTDAAQSREAALREALEKYGAHENLCAVNGPRGGPCDCGLDAAILRAMEGRDG